MSVTPSPGGAESPVTHRGVKAGNGAFVCCDSGNLSRLCRHRRWRIRPASLTRPGRQEPPPTAGVGAVGRQVSAPPGEVPQVPCEAQGRRGPQTTRTWLQDHRAGGPTSAHTWRPIAVLGPRLGLPTALCGSGGRDNAAPSHTNATCSCPIGGDGVEMGSGAHRRRP